MRTFSVDQFTSLEGEDLINYGIDLLNSGNLDVDSDLECSGLLARLRSFDVPHLVFALEIGARLWPSLFLPLAPGYLLHPDVAVACAAARALQHSEPVHRTPELVRALAKILLPERKVFADQILLSWGNGEKQRCQE